MDSQSPKAIRLVRTGLLILAGALASACDQGSPAVPSDLTTTIDTVDGVIRVTNTGTPPEWQLVQVVSIGPKSLTDQGSPDEFGRVSSASMGPDGEVFVADAQYDEIRVFGLDGVHRRTFGRSGEGPGEFSALYSVAWTGDRLLTLDPHLGRVGEFSAQGEFLGQRQMQGGVSGTGIRLFPVGTDETYGFALVEGPDGLEFAFVGHNSSGETGDTLRQLEQPPGPATGVFCEYEGGVSFFTVPFQTGLVQHPGPGGVMYAAMTGSYRIAVIRGESDTLRVMERSLPVEPVSDEEWAAGNQEFEEFRRDRPDASCEPRRPSRPDRKPLIGQIFVAPDGKLWVQVIRTAGNRWEVFDPEGRLLASVPFHAWVERTVPAFGPDHMITIRQDSLDLDHVEVWKIERGGGRG